MSAESHEPGRFSPERKIEAVLRLLRGEDPGSLSRELGVAAGALREWRSAFLAGGQARLEGRSADPRDEEIRALNNEGGGPHHAVGVVAGCGRADEGNFSFIPGSPTGADGMNPARPSAADRPGAWTRRGSPLGASGATVNDRFSGDCRTADGRCRSPRATPHAGGSGRRPAES